MSPSDHSSSHSILVSSRVAAGNEFVHRVRSSSAASSLSSSSLPELSKMSHNFVATTFTFPTFCDCCSSFIWGVVKQGLSCSECGYNVHNNCKKSVAKKCVSNSGRASPMRSPRNRHQQTQNTVTETEKDLVTQLFAETQVQSRKLGNMLSETNPALSIALFMKQNQRYTARQAPFIWINETVIKLITWDSVPNTLIFLLCYTILCLKPILLAILPQLIILYLSIKFYHHRAETLMSGGPLPKPHKIGTPPKIPALTFQEHKLALQSIQNTMGQVADIYDLVYNFYRMIDWSNPELTSDVLTKTVASIFGTIILVSFVPLNIIALFGGIGVFVAQTAIFRAFQMTLAPVLVGKINKRMADITKIITDARNNGKDPIIDVVLFENQRWWTGIGWQAAMLPHERSAWSDETGAITFSSKESYSLPTIHDFPDLDDVTQKHIHAGVFEWADDDWELNFEWSAVDRDGWEYCNQVWANPRDKRAVESVTRRRKWVRRMKLVQQLPNQIEE